MQILDNSNGTTTVIGCIAWKSVHITYKGITYLIPDGYTDAKYTWWEFAHPSDVAVGNTLPVLTENDVLLFLNKNGTHVTVPTTTIIDGSLIVEESILTNALSANCVTSEKILAGSIVADKIGASEITATKINWPTMPQVAPVRHSVMDCKKDPNGNPFFLSIKTNTDGTKSVVVKASTDDPLILAFADWFTDVGARDFIHTREYDTEIYTTLGHYLPNSRHYIVAYRYEDGSVGFGETLNPPYADETFKNYKNYTELTPYQMTGLSAPFGTCSASTNTANSWKAVRQNYAIDPYVGTASANPWWQFAFEAPTVVHSIYFKGDVNGVYRVEASVDDTAAFVVIIPNTTYSGSSTSDFGNVDANDIDGVIINNYVNIPFKRIRIIKVGTSTSFVSLSNVIFYQSKRIVFDTVLYRTLVKGVFDRIFTITASAWLPISALNAFFGTPITSMLYLGEVETDANSNPIDVTCYAVGGKYDSGWFDVIGSTTYSLTTNLGTNAELQDITIRYRKNEGFSSCLVDSYYGGTNSYGVYGVGSDTNNSIKIRTSIYPEQIGAQYVGATDEHTTGGQYRVIVNRGY